MSQRNYKVAVVDDDVRGQESLENLFESAGYEVHLFASARAVLAYGLTAFDCLITDIGMPGMDGFQLRDAVRRERPDLPVFLVTGRHEISDQQRAIRADVAGFFCKPFDGRSLLTAVEKSLKD